MSEPKWWPKGEIPNEDGIYLSLKDGDGCYWKLPDDLDVLPKRNVDRQFYGPIPEPPKEPPKLRRFTAMHRDYGHVSGVYVPEKNGDYAYLIFSFDASLPSGVNTTTVTDALMTKVHFLDKE